MMEALRKAPPRTIVGEEVVEFIDYLDTSKTGLPSSNVLQFITDKKTKVTHALRARSRKIKFYFSVREDMGDKSQYEQTKQKLRKKISAIQAEMDLK